MLLLPPLPPQLSPPLSPSQRCRCAATTSAAAAAAAAATSAAAVDPVEAKWNKQQISTHASRISANLGHPITT
jgi:hypothetical protein